MDAVGLEQLVGLRPIRHAGQQKGHQRSALGAVELTVGDGSLFTLVLPLRQA